MLDESFGAREDFIELRLLEGPQDAVEVIARHGRDGPERAALDVEERSFAMPLQRRRDKIATKRDTRRRGLIFSDCGGLTVRVIDSRRQAMNNRQTLVSAAQLARGFRMLGHGLDHFAPSAWRRLPSRHTKLGLRE